MPLYPGGGTRLGLGLWNSIVGTMVVEIVMLVIGVWLYVHSTSAATVSAATRLRLTSRFYWWSTLAIAFLVRPPAWKP